MPVEDVFAWAERRRATGRLVVERDDVTRTFWLVDGAAVWETSNVPEEQLGQILVRSGLITERALAEALDARVQGTASFGKVLVMVGAVSEIDLSAILAIKVREALCEVASWNEGWFDFDPADVPTATRVAVSVPLPQCLELARARQIRWIEIRAVIPSDDLGFAVHNRPAIAIGVAGRLDTERLVKVIDRGGSAGDAIAALAGERFIVLDVLTDLVAMGVISVDPSRGRGDLSKASPEVLAEAIEGRLAEGDRAGALTLAAQAIAAVPGDPELRRLYKDAERARVAELARTLLSQHHVPQLRRAASELDHLGLTEVERRLVRRVDGRWDLLSLVRSSPFGEVSTLLAFATLADRGIIALS